MPFAYYNRLSPARQRIYRKSDAIEALALPDGVDLSACVALIRDGLAGDTVVSGGPAGNFPAFIYTYCQGFRTASRKII